MSKRLIDEAKIKILDGFANAYDIDVEPMINDQKFENVMKQFARTVHNSLGEILELIEKLENEK